MTVNLLHKILNSPVYPEEDKELIQKAYDFARRAHGEQKRFSGHDFIEHPLAVAYFLSELKLDANTIAAALLHDIIEDTSITEKDLKKHFGKEILFLVDSVTKLAKIKKAPHRDDNKDQALILRKMFLAMAKDIRVVLIKLADRRHNLQTLKYLRPEKQKRIALETINIYAPIAGRLGIGKLKGELEDLSFPHAYPDEYQNMMPRIKETIEDREQYIKKVKRTLEKRLKRNGVIPLDIHSRAKHYYSLFQKMKKKNVDASNIYDLVAVRIVLGDISKCYEAMGIIHTIWRPVPGLIKDYIALPKPNGYKSLHTTVFCEQEKIVEFQIRTPEMHHHAEYGIAAHWEYSESGKPKVSIAEQKELEWVKKMRDWKDAKAEEFVESLKIDFLSERIFVFTPNGDVRDLPVGSTSIDFAYTIHSEIGDQVGGAKVDGKITALKHPLKNGQVVEIIKSKKSKPTRDWLEFVKTSEARKRINSFLRKTS